MIGLGIGVGKAGGGGRNPFGHLFAAGEVGGVIDLSPVYPHQQLFQDTAGLQPVTAPGQTVALAKMRPGAIEFAQASASLRPTYAVRPKGGRRNQLQYTEQFDNAVWTKNSVSVTDNTGIAPDGTMTADKLVENTADTGHDARQAFSAVSGTAYTISAFVQAAERNIVQLRFFVAAIWGGVSPTVSFDLTNQTTQIAVGASFIDYGIEGVGGGVYRIWATYAATASGSAQVGVQLANSMSSGTYLGDGTSGIYVWGAQIEAGTLTPYQRVTTAFDVYEAGKPHYGALWFDGVDDFMVSGTVTPGTDKVQVFTGLRKASDAATGVVLESSVTSVGTFGAFGLFAPGYAGQQNYRMTSTGTASDHAVSPQNYAAPISNVLIGTGDISGDAAKVFVNGTQSGATATVDQGTGNYLAYPLYMGRRGGSSLSFNGEIEGYVGFRFGPNLSDAQLAQIAATINAKTGAYA